MSKRRKQNFYNLSLEELESTLKTWKEPRFRAKQIWNGIYENLKASPEEVSNLPKKLTQKLNSGFTFCSLSPINEQISSDHQTMKTLFKLWDGNSIETVLMKYNKRRTVCISTQAGCALGCVFCATGQMGFKRNLSSGEIVEQVLYFARELNKTEERITNIVIMGMGEPFLNYDETIKAIDLLNHPDSLNLGERRFTISTAGIVPEIETFANSRRQINLAVSLHAANDKLRSSLMQINSKYPLDKLIPVCKYYTNTTKRRLTFEWALIQNVNDTPDHALELSTLIRGMLAHVNVIALNPTQSYKGQASPQTRAEEFCSVLEEHGISCSLRLRRGIDIQAGCGQLASEK